MSERRGNFASFQKANRIDGMFAARRAEKKCALICYITAGDPSLQKTRDLVLMLEDAGADLVELGMPFSDPMADGPVIQRANERALKKGATLEGIITTVGQIRKKSQVPLLLMGYYNPILQLGLKRFAQNLKDAGGDAVLVVDLPPEESSDLQKALRPLELRQIFLLAPTSDEGRIHEVCAVAAGFIYYVSLEGVTGAALGKEGQKTKSVYSGISSQIEKIRNHTQLPIAVGFGIREAKQAQAISRFADGIVVGTALIQKLEESRNFSAGLRAVQKWVRQLRKALD